VSGELRSWNREHKEGKAFDSSSGVTLPDNSVRSPDNMWIAIEKWKAIPKKERNLLMLRLILSWKFALKVIP